MTRVSALRPLGSPARLTRQQWIMSVSVFCTTAAWLFLYESGILSETVSGVLVVVGVPLFCSARLVRELAVANRNPSLLLRAGTGVLALSVMGTVTVAAVRVVEPGMPLVEWQARTSNEALQLPENATGRVRLLAKGNLQEGRQAFVTFAISGTNPTIEGEISRSVIHSRAGKRRKHFVQEHTAEFVRATIPEGAKELRLTRLAGQLDGPLNIAVFRDVLPRWMVIGASVVALIAMCWVDFYAGARGCIGSPALTALSFGVLFVEVANPERSVGSAIGVLVLAAIAGAVLGRLLRKFRSARNRNCNRVGTGRVRP